MAGYAGERFVAKTFGNGVEGRSRCVVSYVRVVRGLLCAMASNAFQQPGRGFGDTRRQIGGLLPRRRIRT